jgi:hypothetical protein
MLHKLRLALAATLLAVAAMSAVDSALAGPKWETAASDLMAVLP